jgi:hypothetical protein
MFFTARPRVSFRPERPVFFPAREASTGREVEESLFDRSRSQSPTRALSRNHRNQLINVPLRIKNVRRHPQIPLAQTHKHIFRY